KHDYVFIIEKCAHTSGYFFSIQLFNKNYRSELSLKESEDLLKVVVSACEERKAENCVVLNMEELSPMADYFVICHGTSERQVHAIARSIKDAAEDAGYEINRMEGLEQSRWILIDLGDIICHVFHKEERSYYNLERLWGDAAEVAVSDLD